MNNSGIDVTIWKQLRKKWIQLDASGKSLKVDFKLITTDAEKDKTLAIDVVQTINDEVYIETVQQNAGEAYSILGIDGLSRKELVQMYKKMLHELYRRVEQEDVDLVVEMTPHSPTSGETKGYLQQPGTGLKTSVMLNYQHYYVLSAIREKMIELAGDGWSQAKAVYHASDVKFYFDYQKS